MKRIYRLPVSNRLVLQELVGTNYKTYCICEGSRAGVVIGTWSLAQIFLYISTDKYFSKKVNGIIYSKGFKV